MLPPTGISRLTHPPVVVFTSCYPVPGDIAKLVLRCVSLNMVRTRVISGNV